MEGQRDMASRSVTQSTTTPEENEDNNLELEWVQMCAFVMATVSAAAATCMQLSAAALTFHTPKVGLTAADRVKYRYAIVHNITTSDTYCKDMIRLSSYGFKLLCAKIKQRRYVKEYPGSTIEEQVLIFMLVVGQNMKNRVVRCLLHRSGDTISKYFHNIMGGILSLEDEFVKQPDGTIVHEAILQSNRFFPHFKVSNSVDKVTFITFNANCFQKCLIMRLTK